MKSNAVLIDFERDENWDFFRGIKENSNESEKWFLLKKISNGTQKGFLRNLIRYVIYFFFSFKIFCNRKKYDKIVAWQQFYGICLCFFLRFFGSKNGPKVTILTFIYKDKKGFKGKIYKKFINYALGYKNINKIVVLSSYEVEKYQSIFSNSNDKFTFCKIGIDGKAKFEINKGDYYLSSGRSNRDYDFLVNAFKSINKKLVIISDTYINKEVPNNVTILNSCFKDDYEKKLANCKAVIVSLDDTPISSGQLVVLNAYQYKKPVIVTNNPGVIDYVKDGVNGFIINKSTESLYYAINEIEKEDIYSKLVNFNEFYTSYDYGLNVLRIIE